MNKARHVVGAHQWLIIGALQQSESSALTFDAICQHMAPWLYPSEVRTTIAPLVRAGLIEMRRGSTMVRLLERGESVRRSVGKSNVPYFWPLVLPVEVSAE